MRQRSFERGESLRGNHRAASGVRSCVLSAPASNFGMVGKAFEANVDAVLLDREDAVAPSDTFSYLANCRRRAL